MHPDTDRIIEELGKIPVFRAQSLAVHDAGKDMREQISAALNRVDTILHEMGAVHLAKRPHLDRAPYGVFLVYNVETKNHDIIVRVGNLGIEEMRGKAVAQIMSGFITRAP